MNLCFSKRAILVTYLFHRFFLFKTPGFIILYVRERHKARVAICQAKVLSNARELRFTKAMELPQHSNPWLDNPLERFQIQRFHSAALVTRHGLSHTDGVIDGFFGCIRCRFK